MTPITPREVLEGCIRYAEQHSVTGVDLWDVIKRGNPQIDVGGDEDYGVLEMCGEVLSNNCEYAGAGITHTYEFQGDNEELLVDSPTFIKICQHCIAKCEDIYAYVIKDGRLYHTVEQCFAEDL